jgi:hypothetical protein
MTRRIMGLLPMCCVGAVVAHHGLFTDRPHYTCSGTTAEQDRHAAASPVTSFGTALLHGREIPGDPAAGNPSFAASDKPNDSTVVTICAQVVASMLMPSRSCSALIRSSISPE